MSNMWTKFWSKESKETETQKLQRRLIDAEARFNRLSSEIERGYIKDRLGNNIEYIEKLGSRSVKFYKLTWVDMPFLGHHRRDEVFHWNSEGCIELRDFLLKNFPVEPVNTKQTLTGDAALEFLSNQATPEPMERKGYYDIKAINNNARRKYKAFSDEDTDYYELTMDVGSMPKGTVFYHDTKDSVRGSIGAGCLKLCWTSNGNCQKGCACGDTTVFHASFKDEPLFRLVQSKKDGESNGN